MVPLLEKLEARSTDAYEVLMKRCIEPVLTPKICWSFQPFLQIILHFGPKFVGPFIDFRKTNLYLDQNLQVLRSFYCRRKRKTLFSESLNLCYDVSVPALLHHNAAKDFEAPPTTTGYKKNSANAATERMAEFALDDLIEFVGFYSVFVLCSIFFWFCVL